MSQKTVVMISYVYPPDNAIGSVRVGKFAAGLRGDHGWSVQVVVPRTSLARSEAVNTTSNSSVLVRPTRETNLFKQISTVRTLGRRLRKSKSDSPPCVSSSDRVAANRSNNQNRSVIARCSDLLAVPDTRSGWIYWAYREAARGIRQARPKSLLFSSGPPHSAHVAAAWTKRKTGCPWIADLRDPWTENPYNAKLAPYAQRWNQSLERRVLRAADVILCTTEPARERFLAMLPEFSREQIVTVPNGFDPEDFADLQASPRWSADDRKVLLHAGSIYGRRDPVPFLEALTSLHAEKPQATPRVVFLGNWDQDVRLRAESIIARGGLTGLVQTLESVPRAESLAIQAAADWLVLLGDCLPAKLQIPGKLFEYLALGKPIISLFPERSPVNGYLEDYAQAYVSAAPDDCAAILEALRMVIRGGIPASSARRPLEELHRSHQIQRLNDLCASCLKIGISPSGGNHSTVELHPHSVDAKLNKEFV